MGLLKGVYRSSGHSTLTVPEHHHLCPWLGPSITAHLKPQPRRGPGLKQDYSDAFSQESECWTKWQVTVGVNLPSDIASINSAAYNTASAPTPSHSTIPAPLSLLQRPFWFSELLHSHQVSFLSVRICFSCLTPKNLNWYTMQTHIYTFTFYLFICCVYGYVFK